MNNVDFMKFVFDVLHDVQNQRFINKVSSVDDILSYGVYLQATYDLADTLINRFNEKDNEYSEYM